MTKIELKSILITFKNNKDISEDEKARQIISEALANLETEKDLSKIIFKLKQAIDLYSVAHGLKLPASLTKLKIALDKNQDKWRGAGATWM